MLKKTTIHLAPIKHFDIWSMESWWKRMNKVLIVIIEMVNSRLTWLAEMFEIGTSVAERVKQLINIEREATDQKRT